MYWIINNLLCTYLEIKTENCKVQIKPPGFTEFTFDFVTMKVFLAVVSCFLSLSLAAETYSGNGSMKCYGDMSITIRIDGEGFLDCQPAWGSPAAPPQVGV